MDNEQIELELNDLETRIDRLRALYEQYFIGIEKLEPAVPRKEIDRKIWAMRREQIRNTGLRFRFNTITQRYNTYQQYWHRILREIENGTYRRDVIKAAKRFGDKDLLTIAGRKRAEQFARLVDAQADRRAKDRGEEPPEDLDDVDLIEDDFEPARARDHEHMSGPSGRDFEPAAPPPQPQPRRDEYAFDVTDDVAGDFEDAQPVHRPAPVVERKPLGPSLRGGPAAPPKEGKALNPFGMRKPQPSVPSIEPTGRASSPSLDAGRQSVPSIEPGRLSEPPASDAPRSQRAGLRWGKKTATPPVTGRETLPSISDDDDLPTPPPAAQREPPVKPLLGVRNLAPTKALPTAEEKAARLAQLAAGLGRRASQPDLPPPAPSPAPPQRPAPPARPAPAPPAAAAPSGDDTRFRKIYDEFVQARKQTNEGLTGVTYDRVAAGLRAQADKLRKQHQGRSVEYEVVVKDGKTMIKPIIR